MISAPLASRLHAAGLRWNPRSGDRFVLRQAELTGDVFTISDMTIEPHDFATGTVLGFNGTTEWALDSVAKDDALWLPGEDQLRSLLGGTFRSLVATEEAYVVRTRSPAGVEQGFEGSDPADAYGLALLALLGAVIDGSLV